MSQQDEKKATNTNYALQSKSSGTALKLPDLDYRPARTDHYQPKIGLIGCGGISAEHLKAYRNAGFEVVAFADQQPEKATQRRDEFYPDAKVYPDSASLLSQADIDIVDITTHPQDREGLIEDALRADKHVLSQKPFVTDLEVGRRLCQLADEKNRLLAVNQNGRWAPWVSWMRAAIAEGLIGEVASVDALIAWDHTWVKGTHFENFPSLVLYDFAIHWFDMLHCYTRGQRALEVYATTTHAPGQNVQPPLLAQVSVQLEHCQATLAFRGSSLWGPVNQTHITGSQGTLHSQGEGLEEQTITVSCEEGQGSPQLEGSWFPGGFDGAMSELIFSIDQQRQPTNSGRDNLAALEFCFAAIRSAESGKPVAVGEVSRLKPAWINPTN